jgi:hypothetical protein
MNVVHFNIFKRISYNLKTIIRIFIGHYYQFYRLIIGRSAKKKKLLFSRDTDIVIEGFPRVGNTFFVVAFQKLSEKKLTIAHHVHLTCQIKEALASKKPIIVLVRDPIDAVVSLKIREPRISIYVALFWYLQFYSFALKHKARIEIKFFSSFISNYNEIAIKGFRFKESINLKDDDIFSQINEINRKEDNEKANNDLAVSMPTEEKEKRKREIMGNFNSNTWLAQKCSKVYEELIK